MAYNYHKRLTGYLIDGSPGVKRALSQQSYISAATLKLSNIKTKPNHFTAIPQKPHNQPPICHKCSDSYYPNPGSPQFPAVLHKSKDPESYSRSPSNEYFTPDIQIIRKTLVDIWDQMKNGGKLKNEQQRTHRTIQQQPEGQYRHYTQKAINNSFTEENPKNPEDRTKAIQQLKSKIQKLEEANLNLYRQLNNYKQNQQHWGSPTNEVDFELLKIRDKLTKAQHDKNKAEERQRSMQIKIMDMKEELMKYQQILREHNYRQQLKTIKNMNMAITPQFAFTVTPRKPTANRAAQTDLSDVDIQRGYKQVNEMQDQLCDKINDNLKVQKKIFVKISEITEKVKLVHEKLNLLQDNVLELGVPV